MLRCLAELQGIDSGAGVLVHGEKAHSRYFSEDAFKSLDSQDKELFIVKGANHTDLYDNTTGKIPFDKFEQFFKKNLK
nr:alpha/beta hydrolase [Cardiobacterium sp. Marseille-Q4385]